MKWIPNLLIVPFFFFFTITCAQPSHPYFNLDFEDGASDDELPKGWMRWGTGGYSLQCDSIIKYEGEYSGKISSVSDEPEAHAFGSIGFRLPANYEGQTIEFQGYMRIEEVRGGFAGMMLRIDGPNGQSLGFDNMMDRGIDGTRDWQMYTITMPFSNKAEWIFVAGILSGKGEAWFDSFKVLIDGKEIQDLKPVEKEPAKAELDKEFDEGSGITLEKLTPEQERALSLTGKVWGFLKYYHPAVGTGNLNWDYELFRILPAILENPKETNQLLLEWIKGLGKIETADTEAYEEAKLLPDLEWLENTDLLGNALSEVLLEIKESNRVEDHYYISLMPNVGNPQFDNERAYPEMKYPDTGFRLLALFRYWNMVQYFFPYKHLIGEDWKIVLDEFIPNFVKFTNGNLDSPGLFTFTPPLKVGVENPDHYPHKVVILIDETTQSQAEYTTMAFRVAPNATVIGSTTAAADGNVSRISLPGNISTMISGIGVYTPDGRETQRIGIVPDIELKPTIKGIRDGRDELLEKALDVIRGN